MRVCPLLLPMVPRRQRSWCKRKGAVWELAVCKTHYAPSATSRGRKGPPVGKILVQSSSTGALLVQGGREGTWPELRCPFLLVQTQLKVYIGSFSESSTIMPSVPTPDLPWIIPILAFKGPERSAGQGHKYKTITVWIWMPQCLDVSGSPSGDAYLAFLARNVWDLIRGWALWRPLDHALFSLCINCLNRT